MVHNKILGWISRSVKWIHKKKGVHNVKDEWEKIDKLKMIYWKLTQKQRQEKVVSSFWFKLLKSFLPYLTFRSWNSMIGSFPETLDYIYSRIQKISPKIKQVHLLWTKFHLFVNTSEDVSQVLMFTSKETFRTHVYTIIEALNSIDFAKEFFNYLINDNIEIDSKKICVLPDTIECPIQGYSHFDKNVAIYSGYYQQPTLKYQITPTANHRFLFQKSGPPTGTTSDQDLCRMSNLDQFLEQKKRFVGNWRFEVYNLQKDNHKKRPFFWKKLWRN